MRIIPARAGQTRGHAVPAMRAPDHPRACGANHLLADIADNAAGSSPRVRGKPGWGRKRKAYLRIIPARAGQTWSHCRRRSSGTDHPRACGANNKRGDEPGGEYGSSPRVRGKRRRHSPLPSPVRIIPARAGQTARRCSTAGPAPDHPRACGANARPTGHHDGLSGSSPRVRGKRCPAIRVVTRMRIIPARAGQTARSRCRCRTARDHPRACGANAGGSSRTRTTSGSSPRVRGKRSRSTRHCRCSWIIPARAGQTQETSGKNTGDADHPRACGANESSLSRLSSTSGSSPRVRGKHRHGDRARRRRRIIPARAGQTSVRSSPSCSP